MDRQLLTDSIFISSLSHLFQTVRYSLTHEKTNCSKEMRQYSVAEEIDKRPQLICPPGPQTVIGPASTKLNLDSRSHLGNSPVTGQSWFNHIRSLISVSCSLLVIVVHRGLCLGTRTNLRPPLWIMSLEESFWDAGLRFWLNDRSFPIFIWGLMNPENQPI